MMISSTGARPNRLNNRNSRTARFTIPAVTAVDTRMPRPLLSKAFTFIELLVVVLIIGVVAGLIVPNFGNTYARFLLKETAHDIAHTLRYAQTNAITGRRIVQMAFDESASRYWLQAAKGESGARAEYERIPGRMGRTFNIPDGISIESELSEISCHPNGILEKARIYVSDERGNYFTVSTREQVGYVHVFDFKAE